MLPNQECRSCDNFRWIARRCVLDRDEFYEGGYYCREWTPIITKKRNPTDDQ